MSVPGRDRNEIITSVFIVKRPVRVMCHIKLVILFFILFVQTHVNVYAQENNEQPRLVHTHGITQLFVGGKPFLILGGELGNSTASSIDYMRPSWPRLKAMHLNT